MKYRKQIFTPVQREHHRVHQAAYDAAHPAEKRARAIAYRAANRAAILAKAIAYDAAHREEKRAYLAAYYAAHRDRWMEATAIRRGAALCDHLACLAIGPVQLSWQTNEHRCYLCGTPVWLALRGEPGYVHMDHVVPIARGGLHCAENLRPACPTCNLRKRTNLVSELPWAEVAS